MIRSLLVLEPLLLLPLLSRVRRCRDEDGVDESKLRELKSERNAAEAGSGTGTENERLWEGLGAVARGCGARGIGVERLWWGSGMASICRERLAVELKKLPRAGATYESGREGSGLSLRDREGGL